MDGVKILFKDGDDLGLKIERSEAVCYYASKSQVCEDVKKHPRWFNEHSKENDLYLFIKKNIDKVFIWIDKTNPKKYEVINQGSDFSGIKGLISLFPEHEELLINLTGQNLFLKTMKKIIRGLESPNELENIDDWIYKVKPKQPPGLSEIFIEFNNSDELLTSLGLEDDDIHFYTSVNNYNLGWEFFDEYSEFDNFRDGYWAFLWNMNDDNKEKLKDIATILLPHKEFNPDDTKYLIELAELLREFFDDEMSEIVSIYVRYENYARTEAAVSQMDDEIKNFLDEVGFRLIGDTTIKTTIGNLLMWSARLGMYKFNMKSLLEKIMDSEKNKLGGWSDNSNDFYDDSLFDKTVYNDRLSYHLDNMIEKLESDPENKFSQFLKLVNDIKSKHVINKWGTLPKDPNVNYKIYGFDKKDNKVIVQIQNTKTMKQIIHKFSKDNFEKFLYQPELFKIDGLN